MGSNKNNVLGRVHINLIDLLAQRGQDVIDESNKLDYTYGLKGT